MPDAAPRTRVYLSCATPKQIVVYDFDTATGALTRLGEASVAGTDVPSSTMPLAISPDRRFLYAALRTPPFPVVSYAIDGETGALTPIGGANLPESMPYIATDRTGRHLLSASYGGAVIASNPIDTAGQVHEPATQVMTTAPKAHCIVTDPSNRFVYVPVLGGDHLMQLRFDAATGTMEPLSPPVAPVQGGAGPRHLAFHPHADIAYAINELDGTVNVFARDPSAGTLRPLQSLNLMPEGTAATPSAMAADIHVTPDGRFLYASERFSSTIAGFAISPEDGSLRRIGSFEAETVPRGFAIDPHGRFLLAAGTTANALSVYAIEPESGQLRRIARHETPANPNWVEITTLPN